MHGNVKSLLKYNRHLAYYKRIDYDYDLVSGNVHQVAYQQGERDQFFHRYEYDSDNRIRHVYTSRNGVIWDEDATYEYYDHGPLARVELAHDKVAGQDYYYTLQGWLKGVNMPRGDTSLSACQYDPGQDGYRGASNPHRDIARDRFGYALSYNSNDYSPVSSNNMQAVGQTTSLGAGDLFNGNITAAVYDYYKGYDSQFKTKDFNLRGVAYEYDQLNRLVASDHYNYTGSGFGGADFYNTTYQYDANGNIELLTRSDEGGGELDELVYSYPGGSNKTSNKLQSVTDNVPFHRLYR